jgi:hypothetical protein
MHTIAIRFGEDNSEQVPSPSSVRTNARAARCGNRSNAREPLIAERLSFRSVDLGKWKGDAVLKRYAAVCSLPKGSVAVVT